MTKPSRANRNRTSTSLQPQLPYCSFRRPIPSCASVSNTPDDPISLMRSEIHASAAFSEMPRES
jgi:hypothetical protein